ncbi:trypsin-like serine peptidase [Caulobacter endophyticus]|uniref:trypsin-like serine peptidase n=1 Tax=Caulobacter endophyticus TaxID=2172652 RepID=UPI00240F7533|nr:trypsin-like peptidase domain-containing protein [Caulobacter endophyticus]MDG2528487.1 trypsin-like peptidase domain-containing protein [Caulobacter endophyticus]
MTTSTDDPADGKDLTQKADAWRARLGIGQAARAPILEATANSRDSGEGPGDRAAGAMALEAATDEHGPPEERIERARAQMRELVNTQFGGDQALLDGVEALAIDAREATALLQADITPAAPPNWISLEAVVAFDGTRPSFLVQNGEVQLEGAYAVERWRTELAPFLTHLNDMAACVGRVERGEIHIGTAFLIGPELVLTNRHVVQSISFAGEEGRQIYPGTNLDFGREYQGRATHDRRKVLEIVAMGVQTIEGLIVDHRRLDLALLRVSPSTLTGAAKQRFLKLSKVKDALEPGLSVVTAGYPVAWQDAVPEQLQIAHGAVLARLLAGDGGSKRLSPGLSQGMLATPGGEPSWTGLHDATTLRGNSGSPMAVLGTGALKVRGLHYGGAALEDRVNWCHLLQHCLVAPCLPSSKPLGEILQAEGVEL